MAGRSSSALSGRTGCSPQFYHCNNCRTLQTAFEHFRAVKFSRLAAHRPAALTHALNKTARQVVPRDVFYADHHWKGAVMRFLRPIGLGAGALCMFLPQVVHAADYCRMYSNLNQTGATHTVTLPAVTDTHSPVSWSTSSRRAIGEELDGNSAAYESMESIRIRAVDSAVFFIGYNGDNMDGLFQVVECSKGSTCDWNFGWLKNQLRSFNCQRDLPGATIPTRDIADAITSELDSQIPGGQIETSTIKYGRIYWTNVRARCERTGVGCGNAWQDKYKDVLEYKGKLGLEPKPAWWYKQYDAWFTFWMNPTVSGANKAFSIEETWWQLEVEEGVVQNQLLDGLKDGVIDALYGGAQDLGDTITDEIAAAVLAAAGHPVWAAAIMNNNLRIYPSYNCSQFADHKPKWPGFSYSNNLQNQPCGYGMPVYAYAPVLGLVKGF